jgi:hypothetical protein
MSVTAKDADHQHLLGQLLALARNAHRNIELEDPADYWYRLGQRNAYAHAAGLSMANGVDGEAFAAADRVTQALSQGTPDLAELYRTLTATTPTAGRASHSLTWLGPKGFAAAYGEFPGVDVDFGMRWGERGDQRISLRRVSGATHGLLYAYDPTWDEYAVIATQARVADVEATFHQAVGVNIHMSVAEFAEIYASQRLIRVSTPHAGPAMAVEL